jgi:SPP1 family predicted phage head-tail adaptor
MDSRSLQHRVKIQTPGDARDEIGQPVPGSSNWIDVATVWANIRYLNGVESIKSDAPVSVARASIRIRYRTDLGAAMRVVHGLTVFDVKSVLPDQQGREFVDLVCETGGSNG